MAKLSVVLIVVCSIIFGISSLAERVEESASQGQEERNRQDDQDEDAERIGAARGNAFSSAQPRYRPVPINPGPVNPAPSYLSCYSCTNCANIAPNVSTKFCPFSHDPRRNKCVTYTERYNQMSQLFTIRGCASERGTCAEIRAAHAQQGNAVQLVNCRDCDGDLCNGVGQFAPSFFMATLAVLFTPLLAKNLLA